MPVTHVVKPLMAEKYSKKFRHRQFARQNLRDEIGIGHAVARQGEQRIDGVGQKIAFAGARVEGMVGAPRAAKHVLNPGPHAENAQVFAQGGVLSPGSGRNPFA